MSVDLKSTKIQSTPERVQVMHPPSLWAHNNRFVSCTNSTPPTYQYCTAANSLHRTIVVSVQLPLDVVQPCRVCNQGLKTSDGREVYRNKVSEHMPAHPLSARWSCLHLKTVPTAGYNHYTYYRAPCMTGFAGSAPTNRHMCSTTCQQGTSCLGPALTLGTLSALLQQ